MTIETKYNIGEKVWVDLCNKDPMRGEIVGYHCYMDNFYLKEYYKVLLDFHLYVDVKTYTANKIFPTKEELLKSLRNESII